MYIMIRFTDLLGIYPIDILLIGKRISIKQKMMIQENVTTI